MRIADIYALPGDFISYLDASQLLPEWFPEIPELRDLYSGVGFETLSKEKRLQVKVHGKEITGFASYAQLASLWYDDFPVALLQTATGEPGYVSHFKRLVTNARRMEDLLGYLRRVFAKPAPVIEEVSDKEHYWPDELLEFSGVNFSRILGQPEIPVVSGYVLWAGQTGTGLKENERWLIIPAGYPPPRFVRKDSAHFELVGPAPAERWTGSSVQRFNTRDGDKDCYVYVAIPRPQTSDAVIRL